MVGKCNAPAGGALWCLCIGPQRVVKRLAIAVVRCVLPEHDLSRIPGVRTVRTPMNGGVVRHRFGKAEGHRAAVPPVEE